MTIYASMGKECWWNSVGWHQASGLLACAAYSCPLVLLRCTTWMHNFHLMEEVSSGSNFIIGELTGLDLKRAIWMSGIFIFSWWRALLLLWPSYMPGAVSQKSHNSLLRIAQLSFGTSWATITDFLQGLAVKLPYLFPLVTLLIQHLLVEGLGGAPCIAVLIYCKVLSHSEPHPMPCMPPGRTEYSKMLSVLPSEPREAYQVLCFLVLGILSPSTFSLGKGYPNMCLTTGFLKTPRK